MGLDIGTSGVRAAELSVGKGVSTLQRFGQVALPAGAVRDGEVVDEAAVASALKQLWSQARFSSKKVIVGVAQAMIDVDVRRLPFRITNVAWASGLVLLLGQALADGVWWPYLRALAGMAALYFFYDVLAFLQPRGMGLGDVHLAGPLGLFLGWLGWSPLAVGAFAGFLVGGLGGLVLIVGRRAGLKSHIPFGPYMLVGAFVAVLVGQRIGQAYLDVTFG